MFDLHANRTLAHLELRGGLVVNAGAPGFAKYVHFNRPVPTWRLRFVEDGKQVAIAQPTARLDIPLAAEVARSQTLYLRVKVQTKSSVKVSVRGHAATPVPLNPGWQTVEVKLPAGALRAGENELFFSFAQYGRFSMPGVPPFKAAAAVEWLQFGGTAPAKDETPPALVDGAELALPGGGALYYYVQIPKGGSFAAKGAGDSCTLRLSLLGGDQPFSAPVPLDGSPVDLSAHQGEIRRLGLHAEGRCETLKLQSAHLQAGGGQPTLSRPSKPRNVVFWLTDDTRADRYRYWNPRSRVETPILDAFTKKATRFQVAYVQGNESRVSHASLFTGLYPAQHKFIRDKAVLDDSFVILPEVARSAGLYSIGHIANGYITKRWGFGDGWDFLRNHIHEGGGLKASDLVGHAKTFMDKEKRGKDRPYFLYLGTIDAHVSWRAYEPWISRYDPKPYSGPFVKGCMDPQLDKIVLGQIKVTERDKERIFALYDSDISYNDKWFGILLDHLKQTGHEEDTMIVFTSDHGEEFWEHGRIGHGQSLRQELVHVPLWIYYPPLFPAGKVVEEGVEVLDVLPTIADALGAKVPPKVQGESLIPLAQGVSGGYPRPAIASQYELAHTMRLARYKLWVGGSGQIKLIDAIKDPGENQDLSDSAPIPRRFVSDAMGLFMVYQDRWNKARWGVASNHRPELPADLEK